ncbi:MAG: DUF5320 domain-containing protein [Anaerolineae bacterium]|nr:DUF5320 domain-containing protein [Anaerolineae bacterium]
MPGLDGTGPAGRGPMTGRGQGRCNPNAPYRYPAYRAFPPVYGLGRLFGGLGRGIWGRGRRFLGRGFLGRGRGWRW